jgi:histidinol-phosphate aminotransferase
MGMADLRRCAGLGLPLLLDAAYADFGAETDPSVLVHEYENVILSRTFSKAYCLAGLRIGYVVGDPRVLDYVDRFLVPGSSVSSAALHAGLAALEDDDYHRAQVDRIVAARDRLVIALRALGLRAYDSRGNFVPVDASARAGGAKRLAAELLERGILVRPLPDGIVRITVGREHENDAVLAALGELAGATR